MITNLQHTTVERHPAHRDPARPQRHRRRTSTILAGLVVAAVAATVLTIVVQPQADVPPEEITSPEIHRTRVPGRPPKVELFSPEAHRAPAPTTGSPNQLRSEATRGGPDASIEMSPNQLRSEATRGGPDASIEMSPNQLRSEATRGVPNRTGQTDRPTAGRRGDPQSAPAGPMTGRHLLAEGYYTVPSASTPADPATSTAHALYTPDELTTMRLVREGSLPTALLETDTFVTKRLVNQGLIPAATVR